MNNLLDQLHAALLTRNAAEVIGIAEQIDGEYQGGKIVELPCKPDDAYWHRDYDSGGLELNFEMHDLEEHDEKYRELDCCAFWE